MHSYILLALAFATLSLGYQVTSPGGSQGWSTDGAQKATWVRVDTDPKNFSAVLTNEDRSVMPQNNQVLAALVDGDLLQTTLNPPSGGWPMGKSFRLNFVDVESGGILAQSNEFAIAPSSSSSRLSTTAAANPATSTARPATTTGPAGPAITDASNPSQTSNAAVLLSSMQTGGVGLLALLGLLLA